MNRHAARIVSLWAVVVGAARGLGLAWAAGLGCARAGVIETTPFLETTPACFHRLFDALLDQLRRGPELRSVLRLRPVQYLRS